MQFLTLNRKTSISYKIATIFYLSKVTSFAQIHENWVNCINLYQYFLEIDSPYFHMINFLALSTN